MDTRELPHLLDAAEVADILRIGRRTVTRLARRGQIPSIELPNGDLLFSIEDIAKWIEKKKRPVETVKK